jgi:hypothetical protein
MWAARVSSASKAFPPPPQTARGENAMTEDLLTLSVKLKSGRFESSLTIPFPSDKDTHEKSLAAWTQMVQTGFKIGATEMIAVLEKGETKMVKP